MAEDASIGVQMASGAMAGLVSEAIMHPVDTVRTRLQTQGMGGSGGGKVAKELVKAAVGGGGGGQAEAVRYRGTAHALRTILRQEGVAGLYGGFGVVCSFTVPSHALYFMGYEVSKAAMQRDRAMDEKSWWVHFTAGIVAEVFGAVLWTPQDVIKQRLQILSPSERPNGVTAARAIVASDGVLGLWRGFGAGVATYGPFMGIYFATYEYGKVLCRKWKGVASEKELGLPSYLASGALGGAVGAAATCPLDVLKTRIQVQSKAAAGSPSGIGDVFRSVVRNEGYGALWSGMSARVLWIAPGCAITIAAYEECKKLLLR